MQPSLFIVFVLLSYGNASRIKVKSHNRFSSSSQSSCGALARWICQPKTYKENLGQVAGCCRAQDWKDGHEDLHKACCELAGLTDEGVDATVAESNTQVENDPVPVVDTEPVQVEEKTVELDSPKAPAGLSPKLDDDLLEILNQGIWRTGFDMKPNEKKLVQAFHSPKKPGLSFAMSCAGECEDACGSQGGECQAIQSQEDCRKAATDLEKNFRLLVTQRDKDIYPFGCFVKKAKSEENRVRWNEPPDEGNVVMTSVCGCYK